MQLRLDGYTRATSSLRTRETVWVVVAVMLALFALGSTSLSALGVLTPANGEAPDYGAASFCFFCGGLIPFACAAACTYTAVRARSQRSALEQLATVLRRSPGIPHPELVRALGPDVARAERLVLDGLTLGMLQEDPLPPVTPSAPSFRPIAPASVPAGPSAPAVSPVFTPARPIPQTAAPSEYPSFVPTTPRTAPPGFEDPATSPTALGPAAKLPDPLDGQTLNGTYQIERRLGSGGMGAVYTARHLRTGRRYALKTLHADTRFSPDAIRRFKREATAASAIGHPGIVAVHDFDATPDGVHYLVMDLLEGETLEHHAREGALPWATVRSLAIEIGDALEAAHRAGILHRDLKPANVFLARQPAGPPRVVLLDFGLAKPIDDAAASRVTVSGVAVGTPLYMAPEQARGEPVDVRADVYGLAAMLYELVTGRAPFAGVTAATLYVKLLTEPPAPPTRVGPPGLPVELDRVLLCALAKRPEERYPSVAQFVAALAAVPPGAGSRAMGVA